jgi:lysophospholipase L1-like esterase
MHTASMGHVVLLGDSVFDNAAYVGGGPDVIAQLRERLPNTWRASLRAVDGSVVAGLAQQLAAIPSDATHLIISAGGNDALGYSSILGAPSRSMAESLAQLAHIRDEFQARYKAAIAGVFARRLPTAVCTIYDPRYVDPRQRRLSATALTIINDVIIRQAIQLGAPILDLRVICDEDADFANPIEPSSHGGWKIAGAIASLVRKHDFERGISEVFTR